VKPARQAEVELVMVATSLKLWVEWASQLTRQLLGGGGSLFLHLVALVTGTDEGGQQSSSELNHHGCLEGGRYVITARTEAGGPGFWMRRCG